MTKNQKHRNAAKRRWRNMRNYDNRMAAAAELIDKAERSYDLMLKAEREMVDA